MRPSPVPRAVPGARPAVSGWHGGTSEKGKGEIMEGISKLCWGSEATSPSQGSFLPAQCKEEPCYVPRARE